MTESAVHLGSITDETTPRRAAELYRAAGLDPIPIHGLVNSRSIHGAVSIKCTCGRDDCDKSSGKHPLGRGWESREIHLTEFRDGLNVGLRMGGPRRLVAIDVDGATGLESLASLEERIGKLPRTMTSESGSGGRHLIFRSREIEKIRNSAKKLALNIDVRAQGGQIVVAPSVHLSGGRYRWLALHDVADLPEAWEAEILRLNAPKTQETPALDANRTPEEGDRYERARRYIATMPGAIAHSGGHAATWAVACKLVHGFGLSDEDAFSILKNDYNERCEPEWSDRDLLHKVQSARDTATNRNAVPDRDRAWQPPPPWSDDDYVPEAPEWALPPDEWSDPDPDEDDGPVRDPRGEPDEDVERDAIRGEPAAKREKPAPKPEKPRYRVLSMIELLAPVIESMRTAGPHQRTGVPTGIGALDRAIGGYRPGLVTIMGAKRSFGKTSFSLVNVDAALRGKHGILVFAVEDSIAMYGRRFMARRARLNALSLRDMDQPFTGVQLQRATDAMTVAEGEPFFISAIGMPVEDICTAITELGKERKIELVIVDYLQRLRSRKRHPDRRLMLSTIAGELVDAGKGINAHTLLLSQLRRTEHREPEVEDLKESGDLEDMADHILLGHRDRTRDTDMRTLKVAKNKDGIDDLDPFELDFDKLTASFSGRVLNDTNAGQRDSRRDPPPRDYTQRATRDDGYDFDDRLDG